MSDAKINDLQMFARAGKTREVSLDTLLSLFTEDATKDVTRQLKMSALMAQCGMDRIKPSDSILACVAAYMGWLEVPDAANAKDSPRG